MWYVFSNIQCLTKITINQVWLNLHPFSCKFRVILVRFLFPRNGVRGIYWIHPVCLPVCPSVCPSVCLSVCLLTFRVRPVVSKFRMDSFHIWYRWSMRGCVACDDPWPWPISSRSFGLYLENRVRSLASTVLGGFFLYLAQMIAIIRGCVACYIFRICKFEFLANFWNYSALTLKK